MTLKSKVEGMIVEAHAALAQQLAKKFYKRGQWYSMADLNQVAKIGILKAYRSYEPNRGAFSTLMYKCILHDLMKFTEKHMKVEPLQTHKNKKEHYLNEILPPLEETEKLVVELLVEGYKRKEIIEKLGISRHEYRKIILHLRRCFADE